MEHYLILTGRTGQRAAELSAGRGKGRRRQMKGRREKSGVIQEGKRHQGNEIKIQIC